MSIEAYRTLEVVELGDPGTRQGLTVTGLHDTSYADNCLRKRCQSGNAGALVKVSRNDEPSPSPVCV